MELKRIKPYKARKPEETIFLVRKILHEKLGILLKEEHYVGDTNFYSCRIHIANNSLSDLNIGTNGKGMQFEYALASAYGEFMERLQNQMLIMHRNISGVYNQRIDKTTLGIIKEDNLKTAYVYAPDEKNVKFTQSMDYIRKYIMSSDLNQLEKLFEGKNLTLVPYVNIFDNKIEYLPINIIFSICTSNGMCAGNTPKEAIIQGMSEILERYVIRKIYYENITLPTIPLDKFNNTIIHQKILDLKTKYNWNFLIKDCSCDLKIPAIGVLIIDPVNHKYLFHIGVDPSPITALERTLTEIYQGRYDLSLKPIDIEFQNKLLDDESLKSSEMFKTCTTGSGQYPISLLFGEPSYSFKGFDLSWGESDDRDFNKMLALFNQIGGKVYIRDVSFLGFPAYHIYVPGMSEFRNLTSNDDIRFVDLLKRAYPISRNIDNANDSEIKLLLNYIESNENISYSNLRFCNVNDMWQHYNKNLILSLLYYTISEYQKAADNMAIFVNNANFSKKERDFFSCLLAVMKSKSVEYPIDWLNRMYGKKLVNLCMSFLEDKGFLKYLNISNCYNCDLCKIKATCRAKEILTLAKRMEEVYVENMPDQNKLLKVLKYEQD